MEIQELFNSGVKIPSLPDVYYEFKDAMDDPEGSFDEISNIIATDPGLTARLLRIVNSAYFGFPSQIETISHAIGVVGLEQLNNLVISTVIMERFKGIPDSVMNMNSFWKHSIACGLAAKVISTHKEEINTEKYFVAGMLHDIGRLIIALAAPFNILAVFMRCKSENIPLHEAEKDILGFTHADVGKHLLKDWDLPIFHQEIVGNHHQPDKNPTFSKEASIIHVADQIVNKLELGDSGESAFPSPLNPAAWNKLELPEGMSLDKLGKEIQKQFNNTVQVFLQAA
jgi:HD-like signal output (HDOD) protein